MVERHHRIDFATGALVFPGGKIEASDADEALRAHCAGAEGLDDKALALRVGAVRETFEECGVLLARARGESGLLAESVVKALRTSHGSDLVGGKTTMLDLVEAGSLQLATDLLVPFAHWITPEFMPKRFDTHFYLAAAPVEQVAAHDGSESVDSVWIRPADAIAQAEAGQRTIVFATLRNLHKLARSAGVAEAIERARNEPIVTVLPTVGVGASGRVLRIPPEAGYDVSEAPMGEGR